MKKPTKKPKRVFREGWMMKAIYIPTEIVNDIRKIAEVERRSMNAQFRLMLEDAVKEYKCRV